MKASELIEEIQKLIEEHGDQEVIDIHGNRIHSIGILEFFKHDKYIELKLCDDDGKLVLSK